MDTTTDTTADATTKAAATTTDEMLKEPADRSRAYMLLGTRRAGGKMAPVTFRPDAEAALSAATALRDTGWHTIEVFIQVPGK